MPSRSKRHTFFLQDPEPLKQWDDSQDGRPAVTEKEKYLRVATYVHTHASVGKWEEAAMILKALIEHGVDHVSDHFTAKPGVKKEDRDALTCQPFRD